MWLSGAEECGAEELRNLTLKEELVQYSNICKDFMKNLIRSK